MNTIRDTQPRMCSHKACSKKGPQPIEMFKWRSDESGWTKMCSKCRARNRRSQNWWRERNPEKSRQKSRECARRFAKQNPDLVKKRNQEHRERRGSWPSTRRYHRLKAQGGPEWEKLLQQQRAAYQRRKIKKQLEKKR